MRIVWDGARVDRRTAYIITCNHISCTPRQQRYDSWSQYQLAIKMLHLPKQQTWDERPAPPMRCGRKMDRALPVSPALWSSASISVMRVLSAATRFVPGNCKKRLMPVSELRRRQPRAAPGRNSPSSVTNRQPRSSTTRAGARQPVPPQLVDDRRRTAN